MFQVWCTVSFLLHQRTFYLSCVLQGLWTNTAGYASSVNNVTVSTADPQVQKTRSSIKWMDMNIVDVWQPFIQHYKDFRGLDSCENLVWETPAAKRHSSNMTQTQGKSVGRKSVAMLCCYSGSFIRVSVDRRETEGQYVLEQVSHWGAPKLIFYETVIVLYFLCLIFAQTTANDLYLSTGLKWQYLNSRNLNKSYQDP